MIAVVIEAGCGEEVGYINFDLFDADLGVNVTLIMKMIIFSII